MGKGAAPSYGPTQWRYTIFLALLATAPCGWTQVNGVQVTSGSAQIKQTVQNGTTTTITQSTETATLSWKTFNVGAADVVNFVQPSRQSLTINKISDTNGSTIMGRINATGQVWLMNPNGVLFGKSAQVNVGSILASALTLPDAQDKQVTGNWSLDARGDSMAEVINQGQITVAQDGYAALLAHRVSNTGSLTAPFGAVVLGSGSAISVHFQNSKLLGIEVGQHQLGATASNSGEIRADAGLVILSAGARASLLASAVNQSGRIQARTASMRQGKIVLSADAQAGQLVVGGTIDASAPEAGDGGRVEITGASLQFAGNWQADTSAAKGRAGQLQLSAAKWSIDRNVAPESFNVISSDTVGKLLASNNLSLLTNTLGTPPGDIAINGSVSWRAPTTLALRASGDIRISDVLTSGHSAGGLQLAYGLAADDGVIAGKRADYWIGAPVNLQAGPNFSTQLGISGAVKAYTVITALGEAGSTTGVDLQGISQAPDKLGQNYVLGADIVASDTTNWNKKAGFKPLFSGDAQSEINSFQGTFDGLGHVISGLVINRPNAGVQSFITSLGSKGVIQNLGLRDIAYDSHNTGGIVFRNYGLIRNSFVDGGYVQAGENFKNLSNYVGGLVGNNVGQIIDCYANVTVGMQDALGTYRTDSAFNYRVGGLVGINGGSIVNSYAKGLVLASDRTVSSGGILNQVIYGGGLVGYDSSIAGIVSSYWIAKSDSSFPTNGAGWKVVGRPIGAQNPLSVKPDSAMTRSATQANRVQTFADWNLDDNWLVYEGHGTPYLRAFMAPLYVQVANPMQKVYDGTRSIDTGSSTLAQGLTKNLWGDLVGLLDGKNAGIHKVHANGLYSDQAGYQVRYDYQQPTVLVSKAPLHIYGVKAKDKAYDGTTYAVLDVSALQLDGLIFGDDVSVKFSGNFVSKGEGAGKQVLIEGQIAGIERKNYDIVLQADTAANITKALQSYLSEPTKTVKGDSVEKIASTVTSPPSGEATANTTRVPLTQQTDATNPQKATAPEIYDKFDKYLAAPPPSITQPVVYDKFDKYLVTQVPTHVQALRDSPFKGSGEVPSAYERAEREGVRSDATSDADTGISSHLEEGADTKPQTLRVVSAKETQERRIAAQGKGMPVTLNVTCLPSSQDLGASVRITCQAKDVSGKK